MKIIDVHTHGIGGYDTTTASVDDILKIAKIHGSFGVSEIVLTIYPAALKVMRKNMDAVKKAMEIQDARCTIQDAGSKRQRSEQKTNNNKNAKIIGVYLEGPFLNRKYCGALKKSSFQEPSEYALQKLIDGFEKIVKIITVAPELKGSLKLIKKISDKDIIVSMGHSDATFSEAEAGFHAGARGITHIFNAMRSFHHREPGLAGFGLLNKDIYIEVIADPHHLHSKTIELIFRTKSPQKILLISDTVKESLVKRDVKIGIKDSSDRLLGGSMPVTESAKRFVQMGLDESVIRKCFTANPNRYLRYR